MTLRFAGVLDFVLCPGFKKDLELDVSETGSISVLRLKREDIYSLWSLRKSLVLAN
jgi:hypothetical protein